MPFEKGRAKTGGRQRGTPNRATVEIKQFAAALFEDPDYQDNLKRRIMSGKAPHMEVLLAHYRYGKPKTELDLKKEQTVIIVDRNRGLRGPEASTPALEDRSGD